MITSVITGDIINSRNTPTEKWQSHLKKVLNIYGVSPDQWEIFRGDSFQLEVFNPEESLLAALQIKSSIRLIDTEHVLDVRMGIGIGEKDYKSLKISESTGTAFINAGDAFDELNKDDIGLRIKTPWPDMDEIINFNFTISNNIIGKWSPGSAELIFLLLENPALTQMQLSELMKISQPSVSQRLKRADYVTIIKGIELYKKYINKKLNKQ